MSDGDGFNQFQNQFPASHPRRRRRSQFNLSMPNLSGLGAVLSKRAVLYCVAVVALGILLWVIISAAKANPLPLAILIGLGLVALAIRKRVGLVTLLAALIPLTGVACLLLGGGLVTKAYVAVLTGTAQGVKELPWYVRLAVPREGEEKLDLIVQVLADYDQSDVPATDAPNADEPTAGQRLDTAVEDVGGVLGWLEGAYQDVTSLFEADSSP